MQDEAAPQNLDAVPGAYGKIILHPSERGNFDARRGGTAALYSYMREDANEVLRKIYLSDQKSQLRGVR